MESLVIGGALKSFLAATGDEPISVASSKLLHKVQTPSESPKLVEPRA
jgi:hypothetical protein